jgi:hypothetical protein
LARSDLIAQIDAEIAHLQAEIAELQHAKTSLSRGAAATPALPPVKSGRGRPKGSKNATKVVEPKTAAKTVAKAPAKKRTLSPEGRQAIADAMKRRWEERRKAAGN